MRTTLISCVRVVWVGLLLIDFLSFGFTKVSKLLRPWQGLMGYIVRYRGTEMELYENLVYVVLIISGSSCAASVSNALTVFFGFLLFSPITSVCFLPVEPTFIGGWRGARDGLPGSLCALSPKVKVGAYLAIGLYLLFCVYSIAHFFMNCNRQVVRNIQKVFVSNGEMEAKKSWQLLPIYDIINMLVCRRRALFYFLRVITADGERFVLAEVPCKGRERVEYSAFYFLTIPRLRAIICLLSYIV